MRYLQVGLRGPDVMAWETFLRGIYPDSSLVVDGVFDQDTKLETERFQRDAGFFGDDVDGIVGNMTLGKAAAVGFSLAVDQSLSEVGPTWPAVTSFPGVKPINSIEREKLFGKFSYVAAPVAGNAEAIRLTDNWARDNIVTVSIPQLKGVLGTSPNSKVQFHAKGAKQLQDVFAAWEAAGLKDRVLTWGGTWVPRFVRGSRTALSNHAWGTAFDINVQWNMLGTVPALKGKKGSVRELVGIATEHGFYWGGWGWNSGRADGMHFELYKII